MTRKFDLPLYKVLWAKVAKPLKKYANQIFLSLFYIDVKESEIIFCGSNCTNSLIFANKSIKFHLVNFIHEDDLLKLKCQFPMQKLLDDKVLSENNEKENIQSCFFSASSQFMCPA